MMMTMVNPATFQTTMAMIDQKAGVKVASRLNLPAVRPRSAAAGLNRPASTSSSHDHNRLAEAKPTTTGRKKAVR